MRRTELQVLIDDLGRIPVELRRDLRPAVRRAAEPVLADARRRAGWSSRIPGAIRIAPSFAQRNPGVRLVTDADRAPHARPFEVGSQRNGSTVRHPVFGRRDTWVTQATRPFFFPAVRAQSGRIVNDLAATVDVVARRRGFR